MEQSTHQAQAGHERSGAGLLPLIVTAAVAVVVGCGLGLFSGWALFGQNGEDAEADGDAGSYASMACAVLEDMPEPIDAGDLGLQEARTAALTSLAPLTEAAALQDSAYDELAAHAVDIRTGVQRFDVEKINAGIDGLREECEALEL